MKRLLWVGMLLAALTAPVQGQMPAGLTAANNIGDWCEGTFTGTYTNFEPSKVLLALQRAKACGFGLVMVYPRRLYTTNGQNKGPYSASKHRVLSDAYARVLVPDTARKYTASRTLLGLVVGDDYGCAPCWGGTVIPWTEARNAANYAKQKMPKVPIGVRLDAIKMSKAQGWKIDFGWAQWVASKYMLRVYSSQSKWYALNATSAKTPGVKVGMFYGFNTADCYGATPHTRCPASTVKSQGAVALQQPQNCGLFAWYYEPAAYTGAYKIEWGKVIAQAKTKPFTSCLTR